MSLVFCPGIVNRQTIRSRFAIPPFKMEFLVSDELMYIFLSRSSLSSEIAGFAMEGVSSILTASNYVYVACGPGLVHCYKYNPIMDRNEENKLNKRKRSVVQRTIGEKFYYSRVKEIRIPTDPNMSTDTGLSSNQIITQLCVSEIIGNFFSNRHYFHAVLLF